MPVLRRAPLRTSLGGLLAALVLSLPAQAMPEECVSWASICVPGYILRYLPPEPGSVDPEAHYIALVAKYWPADLRDWAWKIIRCETGGTFDPKSYNESSGAAGLFQFLRSTWDRGPAPALGLPSYDSGAPYNPEWNIQAAAWLYANWGGTSQWSCRA